MQDLTQGRVGKVLLKFSLPLFLSTVIQAIINLSDLIIVAIFSNQQGIVAGVGLAGQVNYLVINAVIGLSIGGSILISQYFGAKSINQMNSAINTLLTILLLLAIIFTIIMTCCSTLIIRALKTPASAFAQARDYLFYTMTGLIFIFLYNGFSAILRGLGDSITPLIFIGIAAIINIGLDILAVLVLKMAAIGVALATVVSQLIGALISGIYLIKKGKQFNLTKFKFSFNKDKIKNILKIGIPTSIQNIVASFSFIAMTYIINIVGGDKAVYALAAAGMAFKINSFAVLPSRSMNNSIASMVGQNIGAKNHKRVKQTFFYGLLYGLLAGAFFTTSTFLFAKGLLRLFKADNQTLAFGIPYVRAFAFDYMLLPLAVSQYGLVDGLGKTKISMWVNSITSLGLRVTGAYLLGKILNMGMLGIGLSIPITSLASAIIMFIIIRTKIWKQIN